MTLRSADADAARQEPPEHHDEGDVPSTVPATVSLPSSSSARSAGVARGALVGRYVILDELGVGGMGRVYRAFDPDLARPVAVKLVHNASSEGQARLLREAQTMAQLSHPNVVAVYDVGTYQDQVFLAMEFVDGWTMRAWLELEPRAWRDIVRHYVAAGRGLAAAHRSGIVHRDFKPDNVVIGRDGRARVTDFGLALGSTTSSSSTLLDDAAPSLLGVHVTQNGAVLGTPGYVAPELGDGHAADARSDQYGFCASLFEALVGTLPDGKTPADARRAPPWLLQLLERGLQRNAGDRYPDMDALLDALVIDRAARRRRRLAVMAVAVGLAGAGGAVSLASRGLGAESRTGGPCGGARAMLAGVWDAGVRARVASAVARSGAPYEAETLAAAQRSLDDYASDWVSMRTETCEATAVRHDQDPQMLALRLACLEQRRDELAALTRAAQAPDARVVERLTQATSSLSTLSSCADRAALRLAVAPPADPSAQVDLDALRVELGEARVAWTLGRYAEGRVTAASAVSHAQALHARSLEAEAHLILGKLAMGATDGPAAEQALEQAVWAAEAARRDDVAAEASQRLALAIGYLQGRPNEVSRWLALAAAVEERMGAPSAVKIERLSVLGILASRRGDFANAVAMHREALALATQIYGPDSFMLAKRHADLGASLVEYGQPAAAIVELERGLEIRRAQQGASHPEVAMQLSNLATAYSRVENGARAIELLTEAIAMRERLLGPDSPALVLSLNNLASVMLDEGRAAEALPWAQRAVDLATRTLGPEHVSTTIATITLGGALTRVDRFADAEATLMRALAQAKKLGPDHSAVVGTLETLAEMRARQRRPRDVVDLTQKAIAIRERTQRSNASDLAHPLAMLGEARLALGQPRDAVAPLERALAIRIEAGTPARAVDDARFALAKALWQSGIDRERAIGLASATTTAGPGSEERATTLAAWTAQERAAHPSSRAP